MSEQAGEAVTGITERRAIEQPTGVEGRQTSRLRRAGYRLEWSELIESGACWVGVFRDNSFIDSAAGFEPPAMLVAVIATLPPRQVFHRYDWRQ